MKLLEEKDIERYKSFLESHDRCNFQQSLEWGKVKTSWIKEVILSEDKDGNIRGSLCVWIRKIPIFGNIMYSARGPVCDIHDEKVIKDLVEGANALAKKYKAFVLRVEPDILKSDEEFRSIVSRNGFKIKDDGKDFKDEIQPRFVFRLDLKGKTEDQVFADFHQKTRYNVRLATKKGVVVKEGTKIVNKFINFLNSKEIDKSKYNTSGFNVREEYKYVERVGTNKRVLDGYTYSQVLEVKMDIDLNFLKTLMNEVKKI